MTYRELLSLYKAGVLDEEQRRAVEADIEKQDAISEYLCDEAEIPLLPEPEASRAGEETAFADTVRRSIRRAFVKMGVIVGAAVLALVLCAVFLLPRLVSHFYYDPTDIVARDKYGIETTRMDLDMAVYSELFLPGKYRDRVNTEAEGYGVYSIVIPQTLSFNGRFTAVSGRLVRNRLTLYDANTLRLPTGNAFLPPEDIQGAWRCVNGETGEPIGAAGTRDEAVEKLRQLDPRDRVIGYVSLAEITNYGDFMAWLDEKDVVYGSLWCAAYTEDEDGIILGENIGFSPRKAGAILGWDEETYPLLIGLREDGPADDEESVTTHFVSLLRYMDDHADFREMMGGGGQGSFRDMAESVERDGLRLYGFAIGTKPEMLLTLSEDPAVSYVYTEPLP